MNKKQQGFSAFILLMLVLVLCVLIFAGWYVYHSNQSKTMHYPSESVELTYSGNGTYKSVLHSDYTDSYTGEWRLIKTTTDNVLLYKVPNVESHSPSVSLIKDGQDFSGIGKFRPSSYSKNPAFSANTADLSYLKKNFNAFTAIAGKSWVKSGNQDSGFRPLTLTFNENGTYTGTFKNGCSHTAPWSIYLNSTGVSLSFEEYNFCDTRRESHDPLTTSGIDFVLRNNKLEDPNYDYNSYVLSQ